MTRIFWMMPLVGMMLVQAGCGTMCRRPLCGTAPAKSVFVAPAAPSPVVPAGGVTFGPPNGFPTAPPNGFPTAPPNGFPTAPPSGATFGPPSGFPTAPPAGRAPSITPTETPPPQPRIESKWQPSEKRDVSPRIQLYAPEPTENAPPRSPSIERKPDVRATFPAIGQFAVAKENVYAGLRPRADGFDWLAHVGVKTVVQVRLFGEDDSADRKLAEDRKMQYIAFEVSPVTLTPQKADEFVKLIRDGARQGIFVYDEDGSLAGAMWYLYLRQGEILDDDAAQLRARALGLQNNRDGQHRDMWLAVQKLLSENNR